MKLTVGCNRQPCAKYLSPHFLAEKGARVQGIEFTARTVLRFALPCWELLIGPGPELILNKLITRRSWSYYKD